MPTLVTLMLRTDAKTVADDGSIALIGARPDTIDLDALTPRARALAEAVAQLPGGRKSGGEILCEHLTLTRADMVRNPEVWLSPEQMGEPARQSWSAWDRYPAGAEMDPVEYLERQARKIPPEWRIVSAWAMGSRFDPVPSAQAGAADDGLTARGVIEFLAKHYDRHIGPGTWRAYAARDQAPKPIRRVGREGLWSPSDVHDWARGVWVAPK